jgi:DNA helicase-2/ATP-dependent DNA helicase PcrA
VSDWDLVSAEREFSLDVDGVAVIGYIDAVYRTPDGGLRVIDYEATERTRSLEDDRQLPLYLLACRDLLDEDSTRPATVRRSERARVEDTVVQRGKTGACPAVYHRLTRRDRDRDVRGLHCGEHCQWCPHRSLRCRDGAPG